MARTSSCRLPRHFTVCVDFTQKERLELADGISFSIRLSVPEPEPLHIPLRWMTRRNSQGERGGRGGYRVT